MRYDVHSKHYIYIYNDHETLTIKGPKITWLDRIHCTVKKDNISWSPKKNIEYNILLANCEDNRPSTTIKPWKVKLGNTIVSKILDNGNQFSFL